MKFYLKLVFMICMAAYADGAEQPALMEEQVFLTDNPKQLIEYIGDPTIQALHVEIADADVVQGNWGAPPSGKLRILKVLRMGYLQEELPVLGATYSYHFGRHGINQVHPAWSVLGPDTGGGGLSSPLVL